MKKRALIALWALALVLLAVFLVLWIPTLKPSPEPVRESADIPAYTAGDLLACDAWLGQTAQALGLPDEVLGAQRLYGVAALEGTVFGEPAYGTVYFSGPGAQEDKACSAVYLHSQALSYRACFDALCALYGEPFAEGAEGFSGPADGTALWSKFRTAAGILELSGTSVKKDVSIAIRLEDTY